MYFLLSNVLCARRRSKSLRKSDGAFTLFELGEALRIDSRQGHLALICKDL